MKTEGRVLNRAALIYDYVQPIVTFGQETKINRAVAESLKLEAGNKVLDIGCGTGNMTSLISRVHSGCFVTGIDASASMIKTARRKRGTQNCMFIQALGENLPFGKETFNSVTSALFFHHINIDLKRKTLEEILRILKPGGKLIIADMGIPYTMTGKLTSYLAWKLLRQPEIRENTEGLLTKLIKEKAFINIRETGKFSGYITLTEAEKSYNE